jgi:hypothetical protein
VDQQQAYEILIDAFGALTPEEIENFRYHLSRETPVLHGSKARRTFAANFVG